MIPEEIIEEIQSKTDIVELISSYIPLKRAGRNFRALCPFHAEKTPSFFVNPQRQIFHCFGCGKGGGAIQFVMEYEKVSFLEAVEMLAKKAGVSLPQAKSQRGEKKDYFYQVNKMAADYFARNLFSPQGKKALDYLFKRGLREETIKEFGLGYAKGDFRDLLNYLRGQGVSLSVMSKLSLISSGRDGSYFDLFRDRAMFPILDVRGRVIGFGGRALVDSLPKYINTPASRVFAKGRNLFGLNLAKEYILQADMCLVVEGYLDMIMPFAYGIKNIVASLGTALTLEQVRLIKRYTKNVTLVFDSDSAGQNASLRAIDMMLEEDLNVKVLRLPSGYDPDKLVRRDKDKFLELIRTAKDFFFYKLDLLKKSYGDSIASRTQITTQMLTTLSKVNNEVQKQQYLKLLAEILEVPEEALRLEMKKSKNHSNLYSSSPDKTPPNKSFFEEEYLLKSLLFYPEIFSLVKESLSAEDWEDKTLKELFLRLSKFYEEKGSFSCQEFLSLPWPENLSSRLSQLVFDKFELDEEVLKEVITKLLRRRNKKMRSILRQKIKEAEKMGDAELTKKLMLDYQTLLKEGQK